MKLKVADLTKWEIPRNQGRARPQQLERTQAIKEHVNKMLTAGVLEKSKAAYFSQVHLVKKKPSGWRFTVDYRGINDATVVTSEFPLPNICELFNNLGAKKATIFGKIDLTSGYWQMELHKESRHLAAFTADGEIYQPTRVFMGLKNSGSHFQQQMATTVLGALVGSICEVFMDDVLISHRRVRRATGHNLRTFQTVSSDCKSGQSVPGSFPG
jgi:hypothetical protein